MEADCLILGNLLDGRGEGGGAAEGLRCLAVFLYQRDHKICCVYVRWFLLDGVDYPATFPKPWVANSVASLTLTSSRYISVAITIEM